MFKGRKRCYMRLLFVFLALAIAGGIASPVAAEPVPRILLAGDSWTGFLLAFKSFRTVFPEYPGLDRWVEVGNRTAEMGARVYEMLERNYQQVLTEELAKYPNVDVVVITLGGNDILRGTLGVDPTNYDREVDIRDCFNNPTGPPWSDPIECMDWLAISVKNQVAVLVDHILAQRPDLRVAILSYDYAARKPRDAGYTVEQQHLAFVAVQERMRELALERDRVEFIMNFGLMQNVYGIPTGDYPEDGFPPADIPPGVAPYPCDAPDDPDCEFWPGGFPQYLSPMSSYIDQDIHLTAEGYGHIARRAIEKCVGEWLNFPKALQILPLSNKAVSQFQVTYSHPVNGVTPDDFEIFVNTKSGIKAVQVLSVEPTAGPADVYTVTIDPGAYGPSALIRVLDDDSITRADTGVALGGPGSGNGLFEFNGTYEFQDIPQPADDDFEGAFTFLYMASQAYEHLLLEAGGFSFNPDFFDANGNLFQDGNISGDPIIIPGNGLREFYEFMVIDAVLKRPDLNLSATGGATYAAVKSAWDKNIACVQAALGGAGGLADIILPGLDTLMGGFFTIGDYNSRLLVTTLITLLGEIEQFPTNVNSSLLYTLPSEYLPQWFAWDGDADGDGWKNDQEYAYFSPDGVSGYVDAALNPGLGPTDGAGRYEVGDSVRIAVLDKPKYDSTFQWFRNGAPISNKADHFAGVGSRALDIISLQPEDTGAYTCVYTLPSKVGGVYPQATYGPINISVREGVLPAGSLAGLSILALAVAACGLRVVRRKH